MYLEDDLNDAALVLTMLQTAGIACLATRVQNRCDFLAILEHGGIDLILSDFTLPGFDGLSAVKIAQAKWPQIPFIFVSGTLGEERAVETLKIGATDYILKDRLSRLVPAVRRAMQEVEDRAQNQMATQALHQTEQWFQLVFNESLLGMALIGAEGYLTLTNTAFQKMLGYTGDELSRMRFHDFTHPDDYAGDGDLYRQLIQGERKSYQIQRRCLRKDGQVIWARLSVKAAGEVGEHSGGHAQSALGMIEDITEHHHVEAQFIEAQKMEAVGHLASGVVHDFNNILGVIIGYSDLIMANSTPDTVLKEYIEQIQQASGRASNLIRQLLVFSRKQTVEPVVLDLNQVVENMKKMLCLLAGEDIELIITPGEHLGHIKADAGCIGQVLMNLVVNARDAMPEGGKLQISTSNSTLDEDYLRVHRDAMAGDHVMLSVRDTGIGMTDEVKARIFEAFFTTKPKGKGTGLGLATCQTIMHQFGGHIDVCSETGKGTIFNVYFPRVDQRLEAIALPDEAGPLPRGTEILLVVEDDPFVRQLVCGVLKAQGYTVLSATNGQEALQVTHAHGGAPVSLVITDVVMPVMDGKVMARWLKIKYPALKVLFTSGYTPDDIGRHGVSETEYAFLSKPYTPATLARTVRAMLDNQHHPALLLESVS